MGGRKLLNLVGKRFGLLLVEKNLGLRGSQSWWSCVCDCGNRIERAGGNLRKGFERASCGCIKPNTRHGMCGTPEYHAWHGMRQRCSNKKLPQWKDYGGRGITVCVQWGSFDQFFADMGVRPTGGTLDRIDPNGNYEPSNCRWATMFVQSRNKTNNRKIIFKGQEITLSDLANETKISRSTLFYRLERGLTSEQAVQYEKWSHL